MFRKLLKNAKKSQTNKYLTEEQKKGLLDNFRKQCEACTIEGKSEKAIHDVFGHYFCDRHYKAWREKVNALQKSKQQTDKPNDQKTESPASGN